MSKPLSHADFEAQFKDIKARFVQKLAQWEPDFKVLHKALRSDSVELSILKDFRIRAHQLAGSAKTFEFSELTTHAAHLEACLETFIATPDNRWALQHLTSALSTFLLHLQEILSEHAAPALSLPRQNSGTLLDTSPDSRYHILVVDDDTLVSSLLHDVLTPSSCHVVQAGSAEEALLDLEAAYQYKPYAGFDLILLDIYMPGMSGLDFLEHIKDHKVWSHIPVVLLTRKEKDESMVQGVSQLSIDYITKPFDPQYVTHKITTLLKSLEQQKMATSS